MFNLIAQTANYKRMLAAAHGSLRAGPGVPRITLVSGQVGLGKTTIGQHVCIQLGGVWVRALPDWTAHWMVSDLATELGAARAASTRATYQRVVGALREQPRPVFIDEADHLADRLRLVETLRAIHDSTDAPLVLIGMSKLPRAVRALPQLSSRIAAYIDCQPCDLGDVRVLVETLCEVELVGDDLIRQLREVTGGSARAIRIALERLERLARRRGRRQISLAELPEGFEFVPSIRRPLGADLDGPIARDEDVRAA